MTANDAPSPYVASASSSYHAVTQPYKAFDNSDGELGHWLSAASAHPKYLQIDVGEGNEKRLYSYAIHATNWASMDRMPKDWLLQGSNNGDDWDTLDTVSDEIGWGATETREYVCDTAGTTYRYFQIYITANNGDADYTGVGEFYLYEAV